MLKQRYLILILAFLVALISDSLSQSQRQSPAYQAPKTEQGTSQDKRGTKDQPLTVNVVPTAEQQAEAEKQTAETQRKAAAEEKLISYTGDLVLVGIVQFFVFLLQLIAFIVQAVYMSRSAAEMRQTTEAAERVSRDQIAHSHQVERAYISGGVQIVETFPQQARPQWVDIVVDNSGKTSGRVSRIAVNSCPEDKLPQPDQLETDYAGSKHLVDKWIGPGAKGELSKLGFDYQVVSGKVIYGRVYYTDIFDDPHSSGFILKILDRKTVAFDAPPNTPLGTRKKAALSSAAAPACRSQR